MKRKILVAVLILVMCFAFAGCGGDSGDKNKDTEKKEEVKVTSIIGSWECENIDMTDNGEKADQETIKMMFGEDISQAFKLSAYSDGTADIVLLGDEGVVAWTETEGKEYKLSELGSKNESSNTMTAKLDGDKLIVNITEVYQSDGKDQSIEMKFTMKYLGKKSKLVEGWNVTLDDQEVYAMSNAMAGGSCVEAEGMLYGDFGGKEWGKGAFSAGKIKDGNLEDNTVISKNVKVNNLSEYDGNVYGILNFEKIVKIEAGKINMETLYEGVCSYLQVVEDGIYFADEKSHYCKIDFDGQNKETILEKEVYYPYQVSSEFLVYQDDADVESLHVYNMKNGKDTKISDVVSYAPMLCGDYIYFYSPTKEEDMVYLYRVDMYSGKQEKTDEKIMLFDYYVTPESIIVAKGGFVTVGFDEWNKSEEKSSGGFEFYPLYSNGEIWVTKSSGENFMGPRTFGTDDEKSIGYSYVKEE